MPLTAATPRASAPPLAMPPPTADGSLEDFDESGAGSEGNKKETPEEAAARAKLEAARARESVRWVRGAEEVG